MATNKWFTADSVIYAVVDTGYSRDIYKWDDRTKSTNPEVVFELPENAIPDDGMFVHDWCYWWISHIYGE